MTIRISPLPEFLIARYKRWKSNTYPSNFEIFQKLALEGQAPKSMIISCCDSRVNVSAIFGETVGDFFIHRNIANLVPSLANSADDLGTSAAIEYATKELRVNHLIVLGHTGCGGIRAAYDFQIKGKNSGYNFIHKWLEIITPAIKKISKDEPEDKQLYKLEEESIRNSLNNLYTFPNIKKASENRSLSIHGLIYDIATGDLKYLNQSNQEFEKI